VQLAPEDVLVYEYDYGLDRARPQMVIFPESAQQVVAAGRAARDFRVPIVPRGAGTGISGGAVPARGGLVVALTRMRRILRIAPDNRVAIVEPGAVNLDVSRAAEPYGLYFAPDPSSQKASTVGGNVANNAGGPHCLAYGGTTNHVLGMQLVLSDGGLYEFGGEAHESPGYDLRGLVEAGQAKRGCLPGRGPGRRGRQCRGLRQRWSLQPAEAGVVRSASRRTDARGQPDGRRGRRDLQSGLHAPARARRQVGRDACEWRT
jgi:FAD/FMN-containing dehydrogenase